MQLTTCLRYTAYCLCINLLIIAVLYWNPFDLPINIMSNQSDNPPAVIVVGSGLAGLSATIEAVRHGAHVTIVEKEERLGGNSAKATSGINAVGTDAQNELGIEDTISAFVSDTIASGDGLANKELVKILAQNSNSAIQFLSSFGLGLTDVVQLGGHSSKRTHRFPPTKEGKPVPVGFTIVSTLRKYVENDLKTSVTILTRSTFKELTIKDGKVTGLKYQTVDGEEKQLNGTVIFAAGGYANDHTEHSLLDKYTPHLSKYPTTNGPWATGDIIKAVEGNGLSLIHMDKVQVHPTGFVDPKDPKFHTKFLAPEALRGCGALLLNVKGQRFANELGRRDYLSQEILNNCNSYGNINGNPISAAMLLTQKVIDRFGAHLAGFYIFKGLITKVNDLAGAAEKLGVPLKTMQQTISEYNHGASSGNDKFGKKAFPITFSESDVYYLAYITPTLHYCMGGIEINTHANVVMAQSSSVLDGLYAAGEVSGGVHGNNRLGGNSLLECVVFGRIAGKEAAHYNRN
ncbi:uncharacterized protein LOC130637037 isoform X1 [Hydractinia symbiolongicarpus]|uniref:uncharacterized protein LOC130637037 isoform X1 n=2 Tax=Hydractinia symbiolongicarpus TaxID=13093 RepID=UPI0025500C2E|nr:uncharacterized protein LOC130637037 isoform X1 [Hydractinia symbiolongicarpus]